MSDFTPVGNTNYVPPPGSGLETLSGILGVQQRKQALISGGLDIQRQQADLVPAQQKAKETQAGAQLLSDPVGNGLVDQDGNVLPNAHTKILQSMPTTGSEKYDQLVKAATGNVQYKNAWLKLRSDARQDVSARMAGTASDPTSGIPEIHDTLDAIKSDYEGTPAAGDVNKIVGVSKQAIDDAAASHGIQGAKSVVMHFSRGGLANSDLSGPAGLATPRNTSIDQGGQVQPGTTAAPIQGGGFTPAGAPVRKTIPPGFMMGPNGSLIRVSDAGISSPNVTGGPPGAQSAAPTNKLQPLQRPGLNAPAADQARYNSQTAAATQHVQDVSAAANDPQNGTQVTRYRNKQIENILDTGNAQTGPQKELLNHIESSLTGGSSGTPYQTIGHYLAQNSAAIAGKMGVPNTNMGSEQAAASAGNVRQNPDAIREITKVNDGINTAFDLYNRGLAKATNNGSSTDKVPAFRQAFGQNFDMNLFRYEDAVRNGDKGEADKIEKQLGPKGMQALGQKRKVLMSLASTGDLP